MDATFEFFAVSMFPFVVVNSVPGDIVTLPDCIVVVCNVVGMSVIVLFVCITVDRDALALTMPSVVGKDDAVLDVVGSGMSSVVCIVVVSAYAVVHIDFDVSSVVCFVGCEIKSEFVH